MTNTVMKTTHEARNKGNILLNASGRMLTTLSRDNNVGSIQKNDDNSDLNLVESDDVLALQLRLYQKEIIAKAKHFNTIAFLPTGSGKTLIACHLIASRIKLIRKENGFGKYICFIAPTRVLLNQQLAYIKKNCNVEGVSVEEFNGDAYFNNKRIETWQAKEWNEKLQYCEVVGMTPAVLERLLAQRILPLHLFDTVIFDECHHIASGSHPMGKVCDIIVSSIEKPHPRILGLTASPVASKRGGVREKMAELQRRMDSQFFLPSEETVACLTQAVHKPTLYTYGYPAQCIGEIDNQSLTAPDVRRNSHQLMEIARTRLVHAGILGNMHDDLVSVKSNPLHYPDLECLDLAGTESGDTVYTEVRGIGDFQKAVHQVLEVVSDCGTHCGLVAFETALSGLESSRVSCTSLNPSFWLRTEDLSSNHCVATSKVDTTTFLNKAETVANGPFYFDRHAVLFNQEAAICSSLLDTLIVLVSALDSATLNTALETFQSGVRDPATEYSSIQGLSQLLRVFSVSSSGGGSPPQEKKFTVTHSGSAIGVSELRDFNHCTVWSIDTAQLSLNELVPIIIRLCSALHTTLPVDLLLRRFKPVNSEAPLSGSQEDTALPVFSNKILALVDVWVSMSSSSDDDSNIVRKASGAVRALVTEGTPRFRSVRSKEWRSVRFNSNLDGDSSVAPTTNSTNSTNSTLVFCEMKLTAQSLHTLFSRVHIETAHCRLAAAVSLVPGCIHANLSATEQNRVLSLMKEQRINVLFATMVAEEGLDVQSCQLIVNYDGAPKTVKSFIQRRGRARSQHSAMVSLIGSDQRGSELTADLLTFAVQEKAMDAELQRFLESVHEMEVESSVLSELSPSSDCTESERYTVPKTGAFVDHETAIALINTYCESLSAGDAFHKPQPVFMTERDQQDSNRFTCSLLLPKAVHPSARCTSATSLRKKTAKGAVCVAAVQKLHELGELDDCLRVPLLSDAAASGAAKEAETKELSNMKNIVVKTVPDALRWDNQVQNRVLGAMNGVGSEVRIATGDTSTEQLLYLYRFKVSNTESDVDLTRCYDYHPHVSAAREVGIALKVKLSEEVLSSSFPLILRLNTEVTLQLESLGARSCSAAEVAHMQRFHRAVCGLPVPATTADSIDRGSCSSSAQKVTDHDDWSHSSSGAWYMAFPAPLQPVDRNMSDTVHSESTEFLSHLVRSADEAETLARHISLLRDDKPLPLTSLSSSEAKVSRESFDGMLLTYHDKKMLFMPAADTSSRAINSASSIKTLNSVLKRQKVTVATDNEAAVAAEGSPEGEYCTTDCTVGLVEVSETALLKNVTYLEQLVKSNLSLQPQLQRLSEDPLHHLLPVHQLSLKMVNNSMLAGVKKSKEKGLLHIVPEFAQPVGRAKWLYFGKIFPSAMHRVQSLVLAEEARQFMLGGGTATSNGSTDLDSDATQAPGRRVGVVPPLETVLEAITPKMSLETINSERLEMLGDSFLKFASSVDLCSRFPDKNEGFLTELRGKMVSNLHLCAIAQRTGLVKYLRALPLYGHETRCDHFMPPGGAVPLSSSNTGFSDGPALQHHIATVKYKSLADLVEAVVGAWLLSGGEQAGLYALRRLGVLSTPDTGMGRASPESNRRWNGDASFSAHSAFSAPVIPPGFSESLARIALGETVTAPRTASSFSASSSPAAYESKSKSNSNDNRSSEGSNLSVETIDAVERALQYTFKDKRLLREALTHSSCDNFRSNERLEFLGDAVMDFKVVSFLFHQYDALDQGQLTFGKSAVTCNDNLAKFTVKHELYRYMDHNSLPLRVEFSKLLSNSAKNRAALGEANGAACAVVAAKETVGKVLADLCEALVGAVFVDSQGDLAALDSVMREIIALSDVDTAIVKKGQ